MSKSSSTAAQLPSLLGNDDEHSRQIHGGYNHPHVAKDERAGAEVLPTIFRAHTRRRQTLTVSGKLSSNDDPSLLLAAPGFSRVAHSACQSTRASDAAKAAGPGATAKFRTPRCKFRARGVMFSAEKPLFLRPIPISFRRVVCFQVQTHPTLIFDLTHASKRHT